MPRCKGKTARGGRCKLRCPPGSVYCWHHGSNVMRGWHDKAKSIRRRSSRHAMADRCGARECFLEPGQLKYPVCPPHSCEPSCQGIAAARARALILHRKDLVNKADRLAKKLGCH